METNIKLIKLYKGLRFRVQGQHSHQETVKHSLAFKESLQMTAGTGWRQCFGRMTMAKGSQIVQAYAENMMRKFASLAARLTRTSQITNAKVGVKRLQPKPHPHLLTVGRTIAVPPAPTSKALENYHEATPQIKLQWLSKNLCSASKAGKI